MTPGQFKSKYPLWHPAGARGIYGGICIAQSIKAASMTVPASFFVRLIHGQFVLAGNADQALQYYTTNVYDGRTFATRNIRVAQGERTIFTAIISFAREMNEAHIEHSEPMPAKVPDPPPLIPQGSSPYVTKQIGMTNEHSRPFERRILQWSRSREKSCTDMHSNLAALAYICDGYFIQSVPNVHDIWDFVKPPLTAFEIDSPFREAGTRRVGMMVTLSHTMFFHAPRSVQIDEWMLSEIGSHWASDGRGIATQKIWSNSGVLIATCVQEAVVRLESKL